MNNKKSTKRTLLTSVLSLVLCMAMLIGTTFAWFTDTVTSGKNKIIAGNLDINVYYATPSDVVNGDIPADSWKPVTEDKSLFNQDALWEPGYTEAVFLKFVNEGSLALQYQLKVDILNEILGTNVSGEQFRLSDYIQAYACNSFSWDYTSYLFTERNAATNPVGAPEVFHDSLYNAANGDVATPSGDNPLSMDSWQWLEPEETTYATLVLWMPTTVGNEANHKTGTEAPQIDLGISVFATQYTYEKDSFGSDYDKDAWLYKADTSWYDAAKSAYEIKTAAELAGVAKIVNAGNSLAGKTVKIMNDIDLNGAPWTPIGVKGATFGGTLEGQGYTIYNLNVVGTEGVGLIGVAGNSASIYNVNITNATVAGTHYVGAVMGYGYLAENCLKNCTVTNATITCNPERINGVYDNGDKAGVVAGWAANGHITGNKAANSTVKAYRDLGGIVGCAQAENRAITVENNTVDNVTLSFITVDKYAENKSNQNAGEIVGRKSEGTYKVTVGENTVKETPIPATPVSSQTALVDALKKGEDVVLMDSVTVEANDSNAYGKTGLNITNGQTFDGNGEILKVTGATATWDSAINITGGTIKNLTIAQGFRGVFVNHNSTVSGHVTLENVIIDGPVYTISCDQGTNNGLTAKGSTFNGWTSYAATIGDVQFEDCNFGEGAGYAFCRPYAPTAFVDCDFAEGYKIDSRAATTFKNCTIGGVALTAENLSTLVTSNIANATVK